jgi:hypothetical protein
VESTSSSTTSATSYQATGCNIEKLKFNRDKKLFKLCCVLYRRTRWVGHVACMGDRRDACRMLVERPEGKGLFRRPGHKWEENMKVDFKNWVRQAWIGLIRFRIVTGGRYM